MSRNNRSDTTKPQKTRVLTVIAEIAQILESIAALVALGAAAWWFFAQRENYPRADVSQTIQRVPVGPGLIALETNVGIKNAGKKLLKIERARVRVQQVAPNPFGYADLAKLSGDDYWRAVRPVPTPDSRQFNGGELRWPAIRVFDGRVNYEIEPGETDNMVITFLIPCASIPRTHSGDLHRLRIATDIFKPGSQPDEELAWKARAFVDVSRECAA